ncbi:unnamed protein product [Protopolystoma xenopodis]|uniref:Uncharacterized protein n=1 Tax=Protopolystoma xenopodis TaxID=117903 RepID=A0A3S5AWZ7_9PLAT|nr:unnamed protein product [Protopolystoma xenopodis]
MEEHEALHALTGLPDARAAGPERGPSILTRISQDLPVLGVAAWSGRISSTLLPEFACAILSSNLWPGAHAVANSSG